MKTNNTEEFKKKFEERMETLYSDDPEIRRRAWIKANERYEKDMLLLKKLNKKLKEEG